MKGQGYTTNLQIQSSKPQCRGKPSSRDSPFRCNPYLHIAIINVLSSVLMGGSLASLNHQMRLFASSTLASTIESILSRYIPSSDYLPDRIFETPMVFSGTFVLATLVFSMTLIAWCAIDNSKSGQLPNRVWSFIFVIVGLGLEIWAGVTMEEFFLMAMPFTVGVGLIIGSIMARPRKTESEIH
ncbi:hypothetical protein B0J14DRAFT_8353 [Halenospora varia]|nr:hypothetical protein B0J14DRAFT_8353 [Halenospora varia]